MKPHLCFLHWSKWSDAVQGYSESTQIRMCTVCERIDYRMLGYFAQIRADVINMVKLTLKG